MRQEIKIRNKVLSRKRPIFITAEIGVTCNYDLQMTRELIDVVKESGGDAVKLIFWFPDEIMSDKTIEYSYETTEGSKTENMYQMLSKLRFTLDQWHQIKAYADSRDVILFATVNSPSGIEYAEKIHLEAYKLSSWDFNYFTLWRRIAQTGKPMLIDTGPVNSLEVAKVMQLMHDSGNDQSILVHCFHTKSHAQMNMRAIPYMASAFNTLTGYSSANQDSETDIMAAALGAVYLEKRLTLSRKLPGHHHVLSLEPNEFSQYVNLIRNVRGALGAYDLKPSDGDLKERKKWFRQIVANRDIPAGTRLTEEMLEGKRPEEGISPEYADLFLGRVTKRLLKENQALSWEDV